MGLVLILVVAPVPGQSVPDGQSEWGQWCLAGTLFDAIVFQDAALLLLFDVLLMVARSIIESMSFQQDVPETTTKKGWIHRQN